MTHCDACPMDGHETCHGARDPNFCRNARQGYRSIVRIQNEGIYQGKHKNSLSPSTLSLDLSRRLLILACDYRGPKAQCGCHETYVCLMGKGRAVESGGTDVTIHDCLGCGGYVAHEAI